MSSQQQSANQQIPIAEPLVEVREARSLNQDIVDT
jgi:hypothetical protein